MSKISAEARRELLEAVAERYQSGPSHEKRRILDEFVALTGHHRKHAIRVLRRPTSTERRARKERSRVYQEAVREALIVLWEASDRICGKRLKPLLPVLMPALERHGHLRLDDAVRSQLLSVSAATIDRLLAPARASAGRRRAPSKRKPAICRDIPVRTFGDWNDPAPGYLEVDLVAHCGESMAGSFAHTLVLTDIASGWTECVPLLVREASVVVDALDRLRTTMPFPLKGIDTDNGTEFVNEVLLEYCTTYRIEFTRSRPYRKNDQAWVEQKNGAVVRRLVGYGRLEGIRGSEALARLYGASRLFVNFFQPSFKLLGKTRVGARVSKRYHAPETPCARLLQSPLVAESMKERLRAVILTLDPLRLLDEIRTVQHHLAALAKGHVVGALPHRDADLERFLKSLGVAWKHGDARPTHQPKPKRLRHWRTRRDPFEDVWPRVVAWLESEPDCNAKELLHRLHEEAPHAFGREQLRTLQRRVKEWRRMAARRLLFTDVPPALTA